MDHRDKLERFRALHRADEVLVMPNAWDAGSAKILDRLGFQALGTTSAGYAFANGTTDSSGTLTREEIFANAAEIVAATDLPVSGDLENGFGDAPDACAETVRLAFEAGLCGCALEDATGRDDDPIYDFDLAVDRMRAAAAAKPSPDFMLTARSENFINGRPDLEDTIRRLRAFEAAGADVLYAPGLPDIDAVRAVCDAVSKPVNVVLGLAGAPITVDQLHTAGVRRVSSGGSFARAALGGLIRAAVEVRDQGTTGYAGQALPDREARRFMTEGATEKGVSGRGRDGRSRDALVRGLVAPGAMGGEFQRRPVRIR